MAMAMDTGYLADLGKAIRLRYRCNTTHRQSVFVEEKTAANETIWIGEVEVFDLTGCNDANRCYAWEDIDNDLRIVTVLHSKFVDSARRAVQAQIYAGGQPPVAAAARKDASHSRQRSEEAKNQNAISVPEARIKAEDLEAIMQTVRGARASASPFTSISQKRQW